MAQQQLERNRWRVLSITSVGMFMGTLDATIVSVALPSIGPSLHLTYSEALWVQASYLLLLSVFLIPVGRLADRRGLMKFFMIGAVIFGVFSGICALSFNGPFLIAMRCFQGIGAAFLAATSSALVTAVFPPQERGRGLGINVMAGYVGLMVGPAVGGLLVTNFGWRWIFLINVPIAIITLTNGWSLLKAERHDRGENPTTPQGRGIDWPGSILLALTLSLLFIPLTLLPYWGLSSGRMLGMLGAFVLLLVAFVLVEDRVSDPVLDLDIVRKNRVFAAGTFAALLNYAAVFGITVFTAAYLEVVENYSAQKAGLLLLAQPIMMTVLSPVFGQLSDRIGTRVLAAGGMLLGAIGILQLALLPSNPHPIRVVVALAIVGIGMAAFSSPNTSAVMGSVRRDQLSLASGFLATMRTVGQGVSVALLGAIAASQLGSAGARVLFLGEKASRGAASAFSTGYRTAMFAGAGLAIAAALVSWLVGAGADKNALVKGMNESHNPG